GGGELYQVMKQAAKLGAVVTVHAENGDAVWHLQKELVAKGDLGPEFHPVSRPSSVEGEATNRALMMARLHGATAYIVHMTCREAVEALVRAKLEGRLQMLYTYGVCEGRFDLQRRVALGSTNPERIFGLYPRKGTIAVGADADLVIYDPAATGTRSAKTHFSRADRSIFEGFRVKG